MERLQPNTEYQLPSATWNNWKESHLEQILILLRTSFALNLIFLQVILMNYTIYYFFRQLTCITTDIIYIITENFRLQYSLPLPLFFWMIPLILSFIFPTDFRCTRNYTSFCSSIMRILDI